MGQNKEPDGYVDLETNEFFPYHPNTKDWFNGVNVKKVYFSPQPDDLYEAVKKLLTELKMAKYQSLCTDNLIEKIKDYENKKK